MAHPNQITAPVIVNDGIATTGWSALAGTLALATPPDDRYGSTPCLRLTSAVNTAAFMDLTLNATLNGRLQFLIYFDTYDAGTGSNTRSLTVFASNDSGYTNYFNKTVLLKQGWNLITLGKTTQIAVANDDAGWAVGGGSPTWANAMVRIRIRMEAVTGTATRVYVRRITQTGYWRPKVVFGFDDNLASVYTEAFPVMQTYGMKGTIYVIGSKVGASGYCTEAQLQEMYDAGWDLCNHTLTHQQNVLPTASDAAIRAEILENEDYLKGKGWTRRSCHKHFAAPYGETLFTEASTYRAAVKDLCLTTRSTLERPQAQYIDDPVHICCIAPDGSAETLQSIKDRITTAIGCGGIVNFLFHDIATPANTSLKWTPTNFAEIVKHVWLLQQGNVLDVETWTQVYESIKDQSALIG